MSSFFHYAIGYGAFVLGAVLYALSKVQEYKDMAEANPDPKIVYSARKFIGKEIINFARLFIGGIALVIFMPMLIGGATVDIKSAEGVVITNLELKSVLIPIYFLTGYAGNSALFSLFGKYKKTLLSRVGVDDGK